MEFKPSQNIDVGYVVREQDFIRMFNVILPWDDESNRTLG